MSDPTDRAQPADRLPPLPADQLTDAQRDAMAEIVAGPRGELVGPFVPLLRAPELMRRLQRTGEYLRFDTGLDPALVELSILLVARHWNQRFEWRYHCPLALRAGVSDEIIRAVRRGERPDGLDPAASAVWDVCAQLHRLRQVTEEVFDRAVRVLGETGVVELVGTVGYYTTLAMVMNTAATPAPPWTGDPTLDLDDSGGAAPGAGSVDTPSGHGSGAS
jgi:4-carboxymuconolactone decarboxylase